ncbi:MAG: hypothetical protein CME05_12170 [Gemmatimonadaceae bacterium]|nr:hypothetical protein [Gemmatimonadaceae bacterium]
MPGHPREINFHRPDRFGIVTFYAAPTSVMGLIWGRVKETPRWVAAGWSVLLAAAVLSASGSNIAPDAVTRATEVFNSYTGQLDCLTDGLTPDNSHGAAVFAWPTKGNLVFQFDAPRPVDGLRSRVGADAGAYAAIAYLSVEFGESGQAETGDGKMVADVYDFAFEAQTWVELEFPPDTDGLHRADH